jgi:hypothetical protein
LAKYGSRRMKKLVHRSKRYLGIPIDSSSDESSESENEGGLYDYQIDKYLE